MPSLDKLSTKRTAAYVWPRRGILAGLVSSVILVGVSHSARGAPLGTRSHELKMVSFVYPLMGTRRSSDFGARHHPVTKRYRRHHDGIDLAAPTGSIIRSIASGRVIYADPWGGYGNLVVVKHDNGLTSHYGHCHTTSVRVGQSVHAGDIIGTVGSTGLSTGPHLHFEIRSHGKPEHPERYLPGLATPAEG